MTTAPELQSRKEALCRRLSRLDAERERLSDEVRELEAVERVLTRFAKPEREALPREILEDRGDASELLEDAAAEFRRAADRLLTVSDHALAEIREGKEQTRALLDRLEARLASEVNELEAGEPVPTRFGKPQTARQRKGQALRSPATTSLSDAALRAVLAHPNGISASALLAYLQREFGLTVRLNQLGIALQRHRRAGRLELGSEPGSGQPRWYAARPAARHA